MEAKVMLLGIYKSFEELEESLTMEELALIIKASQEKEQRLYRVMASVNGLPWDEGGESAEDAFSRVERNARAQLEGKSEEQIDLEELGFKFG